MVIVGPNESQAEEISCSHDSYQKLALLTCLSKFLSEEQRRCFELLKTITLIKH